MLNVCLLGSGGMMPMPERPLSATVFKVGTDTVLFDCGEGTQVTWRASGFGFPNTSTILLSHVHADHVAGLPGILFQIAFSGRTEPVTVYGPKWTPQIVSNLVSIVGYMPFELRVVELEGGDTFTIGPEMTVSTLQLDHRMPCLGYVIDIPRRPRFEAEKARQLGIPMSDWKALQLGETVNDILPEAVSGPPRRGIRLGLVTDTRYLDSIAPFVAGSNLLVCEAMFADDEDEERARERGHMTFRQAATIARDGDVDELWLTHFSPKITDPDAHLPQTRRVFQKTKAGRIGLKRVIAFPDE
jgi:ribonuclease Z